MCCGDERHGFSWMYMQVLENNAYVATIIDIMCRVEVHFVITVSANVLVLGHQRGHDNADTCFLASFLGMCDLELHFCPDGAIQNMADECKKINSYSRAQMESKLDHHRACRRTCTQATSRRRADCDPRGDFPNITAHQVIRHKHFIV